jgi:flagellar biosynthesis protein FlhA
VSARFALDALPGRQAALEASGLGPAAQQEQREALQQEVDFYGTLEGAIRFVRGDGVATLAIVVATFLGALVGPRLDAAWAAQLALGQGFLTLVPSLITAAAAALAIARAGRSADHAQELLRPFVAQPRALFYAAGVALVLALLPGTPKLPLLLIAGLCAGVALLLQTEQPATQATAAAGATQPQGEHIELAVGYSLLPLLSEGEGLLALVHRTRVATSEALGIELPPVQIRDDVGLRVSEYEVSFRGQRLARGRLMPSRVLAVPPPGAELSEDERRTAVPPGGLDPPAGVWLSADEARRRGWPASAPAEVMSFQLEQALRRHARLFFGRQQATAMWQQVGRTHPAVIADLERRGADLGAVSRVGRELLAQGLSLADAPAFLEALADEWSEEAPVPAVALRVRRALPHVVTASAQSSDGVIYALVLAPAVDEALRAESEASPMAIPRLSAADHAHLAEELAARAARLTAERRRPVLVCSDDVREVAEALAHAAAPAMLVAGYGELLAEARFAEVGRIGLGLGAGVAAVE